MAAASVHPHYFTSPGACQARGAAPFCPHPGGCRGALLVNLPGILGRLLCILPGNRRRTAGNPPLLDSEEGAQRASAENKDTILYRITKNPFIFPHANGAPAFWGAPWQEGDGESGACRAGFSRADGCACWRSRRPARGSSGRPARCRWRHIRRGARRCRRGL